MQCCQKAASTCLDTPRNTVCVNRKHALPLVSYSGSCIIFRQSAMLEYLKNNQQRGLFSPTLNSWASTSFHLTPWLLCFIAFQTARKLTVCTALPCYLGMVFHSTSKPVWSSHWLWIQCSIVIIRNATKKSFFLKEESNKSWSTEEKTRNDSSSYHYSRLMQRHIFFR